MGLTHWSNGLWIKLAQLKPQWTMAHYRKKYFLVAIIILLIVILNIIATKTIKNCDEGKIKSEKFLTFNSENYYKKNNYINNEELAFYIKEKINGPF